MAKSDDRVRFSDDANIKTARQIAEQFAAAGIRVRPLGRGVLESLSEGGLSTEVHQRLAKMCHNKNVDHKRNAEMAKKISVALFGRIVEPV